jgi:DNA-binding HxlR family transcriptional regulator
MPTPCPVQTTVEIMGGKWKPGILIRLQDERLRLSEMCRRMPWISERVLIRQLKELEITGLVDKRELCRMPPHTDYGLTEYGRSLAPLLHEMGRWGEAHLARENARQSSV